MNMLDFSSCVHFAYIACYWKIILLHYTQVLCQHRLCRADHVHLTCLCYNGSLVSWMVVHLTTAKFKPFVFSVSGFTLSSTADMFILMIPYAFCLLPAQFCYSIIVYIRNVESSVQIADLCAPWKISSGARIFVLHALQFKRSVSAASSQAGQA
jgi:hypothetical protein